MASDLPLLERYSRVQGRVHLTGLQALVRLPLDQIRRDRAAGLRVGALVSGCPGPPLAGLDEAFRQAEPLCRELDVRLLPGLGDALALSAVAGTQQLDRFPHERWDGAVGIWYGAAAGLDGSLDALRRANLLGAARSGGALAVAGADAGCRTTSLPGRCVAAFAHAHVPVLAPLDASDVLELSLHGLALSRWSGLWVGLEIAADVALGGRVFELPAERPPPQLPKPRRGAESLERRLGGLPEHALRVEAELLHVRLEAARRYAFANGIDQITERHAGDQIGILAVGRLYRELESALGALALDAAALRRLGIRLYRVRMPYPLDERRLLEFADGLDEIVVLDDRPGFVEDAVRAALCNAVDHPLVLGQRSETGEPWLGRHADLAADRIALELAAHLGERLEVADLGERAERLRELADSEEEREARVLRPCSGHSGAARPEGELPGIAAGSAATGTEGAHWLGLAPFVDTPHLVQDLGEGAYLRSGSQAVRAAVESGATLTYRLRWSGSAAAADGRGPAGTRPLVRVVRDLLSDGVRRVVVRSDDAELEEWAELRDDVECLPTGAAAGSRARRALERLGGVTVLIDDEASLRRRQRRERLARPAERRLIHEDVCEGCGDCVAHGACASLRPLATPLGRRARLLAPRSGGEASLLDGACPAFLALETPLPPVDVPLPAELPEPSPRDPGSAPFSIQLVGDDASRLEAILVRAAEHEGLYAAHRGKSGAALRAGTAVSHCVLGCEPLAGSPRTGWGQADLTLALDTRGASETPILHTLDAQRSHTFASSDLAPDPEALGDAALPLPDPERALAPLRDRSRELDVVAAESLAEAVLCDAGWAGLVLLGCATQRGALPLGPRALERAIRELAVADGDDAVERSLCALRLGRAVAADPALAGRILADAHPPSLAASATGDPARAKRRLGSAWARFEEAAGAVPDAAARAALVGRAADLALDLADYQSRRWARRWLAAIEAITRAETACAPESTALAETAARELYRLMAYKDPYEVARLLLRGPFRRWLERRSGGRTALRYHLPPGPLRALGRRRKLSFGRELEPLLRALVALRRLRGTPLDPFVASRTRVTERALVRWYLRVLGRLACELRPQRLALAVEIAGAPAEIRGFASLKRARVEPVLDAVEEKLAGFSPRG